MTDTRKTTGEHVMGRLFDKLDEPFSFHTGGNEHINKRIESIEDMIAALSQAHEQKNETVQQWAERTSN